MSSLFTHPGWAAAIITASLGLLLVPSAQRLAHWMGFVAVPRVAPQRRVAYLGGPALAISVLVGSQIAHAQPDRIVLALLLATVLGVVGLVDDHRPVPANVRLLIQLGAAGLLVMNGALLPLTGATHVDELLTVAWVVAVVNGINFLDNSDALASCVAALCAGGLILSAGTQTSVAVTAAAIAGGCFAFCAFNVRPATIYLGDAGSMFLGFLLPALALELVRTSAHPMDAARPAVALLALPVIELTITVTRRVLHGRRFSLSAPDNITYALTSKGVSAGGTLLIQLIAQVALTGVAVLRFRDALPAGAAVTIAAGELAVFALATRNAPVHGPDERGSRRIKVLLLSAGAVVFVVAVATVTAAALAMRSAEDGAKQLDRATKYLRAGDTVHARVAFTAAQRSFDHADRFIGNAGMRAVATVPVIRQNLGAARNMILFGSALAHDGARFAGSVDPNSLHFRAGQVPIAEVKKYSPAVDALARSIASIEWRAENVDDRLLLPPISSKLEQLCARLRSAAADTRNAADAARLVPEVFGDGTPRHYLVIAQNLAEARATGGIPGSFGYLDASSGRIELSDFAPVDDLNAAAKAHPGSPVGTVDFVHRYGQFEPQKYFENITMSPDFPTVASVLAGQYERDTGRPVDGVISLDPVALRALLRLTGPVKVSGWPTPITADNVLDVTLRDEYSRYTVYRARKEFLGSVTREVWHAMRQRDLGGPSRIANALSQASTERHLMLWLAKPSQQAVLTRLGLDGGVPAATGDAFFTTVQNAAGSKLDLYTKRSSSYDVTVAPMDDDRAKVNADATLSITNNAPANLPAFVTGPYGQGLHSALRTFVSVYSGLGLEHVKVDGRPSSLDAGREFGRNVYSTFVPVARGASVRLQLAFSGAVALDDGWYSLRLLPQPAAQAEASKIVIHVPGGYEITRAEGCRVDAHATCTRSTSLSDPAAVRILVRKVN